MTKRELIFNVANLCRITTAQAERVLNTTLDVIRYELIAEREVNLIGFGKFSVKERAAREGRNPRTGEPIQLPASKLPVFTASRAFKAAVNQS